MISPSTTNTAQLRPSRTLTPLRAIPSKTGWASVADRENVLVVLPDGVPVNPHERPSFLKNPQLWDAGSGHSLLGRRRVDDLAYFRALFDDLPKHTPVDLRRVYVTGFSNGAAMTFRLAAEIPMVRGHRASSGHLATQVRRFPRPERSQALILLLKDTK